MAEPNFRALAQELFDQLSAYDECGDEEEVSQHWNYTNCNELLHRARTDLATPPPEPPTDKKLDDLWDEVAGYYNLYEEARKFGRRARELGQ